jgi:hypothetical protein
MGGVFKEGFFACCSMDKSGDNCGICIADGSYFGDGGSTFCACLLEGCGFWSFLEGCVAVCCKQHFGVPRFSQTS